MRDLVEFRLVNEFEIKIIESSLSILNPKLHDFITQKSKNLYISANKSYPPEVYLSIFLVSDDLNLVLKQFSHLDDLAAVGLFLGFIKKSQFYLSLEGADFFMQNNLIPNNRLLVANENAEKAILYGNNILKEMVLKYPKSIQKDNILIAVNELNELLAIIITKIDLDQIPNLEPKDLIAQNLVDKGKYLREKQ